MARQAAPSKTASRGIPAAVPSPRATAPPTLDPATLLAGVTFFLLAAVWSVLLLAQPIGGQWYRWMVLLIPGELLAGWFDGPVGWRSLVDRLAVAGVAALTLLPALIAGRYGVRAFPAVAALRPLECWSAAWAVGLGIQATLLLALGVTGFLETRWFLLLWLCGMIAIGLGLRKIIRFGLANHKHDGTGEDILAADRVARDGENRACRWGGWPSILPTFLAIAFSFLLLARATLPPSEYDVREYHLQAPKQWWLEGKIEFLPENIYANMPMGAEIHTLAAMELWSLFLPPSDAWWWGMLSGKVILASFVLPMAVMVGGTVRLLLPRITRRDDGKAASESSSPEDRSRRYGHAVRWSQALALGFPALIEGGGLGLVEPAMACCTALGLLLLAAAASESQRAAWPQRGDEPKQATCSVRGEALLVVVLATSCAAACKYTAAITVFPVLVFAGFFWRPDLRPDGRADTPRTNLGFRPLFVSLTLILAAGGGWYLKNALLSGGNPVYPLLGNWLGGKTLTAEKIAQWNAAHANPGWSLELLGDSLKNILWGWRLQGWGLIPVFAAGMVAFFPRRIMIGSLAAILVAGGIWWLTTHRVDRFLLPIAPLVMVVAGFGIERLSHGRLVRWSLPVVAGLMLMDGCYSASPALGDSRLGVDLAYLRRDDLSSSSVSRLRPHVIWVNKHLTADDFLLVVGDAAVVDYEIPLAYSTTFDTSPLFDWIDRQRASEVDLEVQVHLKKPSDECFFTHILVDWQEIERLRGTYGFDPRITPALFTGFVQQGVLEKVIPGLDPDGRVDLYRLRANREP